MMYDEILSMTPEQLRLAIAKIKGFVKMHYPDEDTWGVRYDDKEWPNCDAFRQVPLPHWSTDMSDAWELAEEMQMTITPNHCYPVVKARWCVDTELKGEGELWLVGAETAPIAICRVYLLKITEA